MSRSPNSKSTRQGKNAVSPRRKTPSAQELKSDTPEVVSEDDNGLDGNDTIPGDTGPRIQSLGLLCKRSYGSSKNDILYHYCSASTLLEILKNKTLRYSDLTQLNDAEERVWGYKSVFKECLHRIKEGRGVPIFVPSISDEMLDCIDAAWQETEFFSQPFVCCLSTDGDSLSQWRAYANDGEGFAIGFNRSQFFSVPAQLMRVEYSPDIQIEEMFSAISSICNSFDLDDMIKKTVYFRGAMLTISFRSIAFKNPAFRDEKEVRSAFGVLVSSANGRKKFVATDGTSNGKKVEGREIFFQARNSRIVPYVDWPIGENGTSMQISKLVLGPKCKNTVEEVSMLLNTLGYEHVEISVAGAAYR